MIKLYSFFHLNTSFSSIEEKDQKKLIKKCYWPLLELIDKNEFKIGIELGGKTLQDINALDKKWIEKFKILLSKRKCELIGSGLSQIIGPLVPEEITKKNLEIGNQIYKKILNFEPTVGLINEQAFSSSMIKIYKNFYKAIIIDWINAKSNIDDNSIQINSAPCYLKDDYNNKIRVIWSNSISFQKFQRAVFGEIGLESFVNYVNLNKKNGYNCIYSNDAEIFNYRAKRFGTENKVLFDEWKKILKIYDYFRNKKKYQFVNFSYLAEKKIKRVYNITNIKNPIIVKKQAKYNVNRWAVCGKDSLLLNTYCWKIFNYLKSKRGNQKLWKTLCELWGSDFRTHTTKKKWLYCKSKLEQLIKRYKIPIKPPKKKFKKIDNFKFYKQISINENFIIFKNSNFLASFNIKKGLALNSFVDKKVSRKSLIGTIIQGEIKNYGSSSDFFSGNLSILKKKTLSRFTDLFPCKYDIFDTNKNSFLLTTKIKDKNSKIIINKKIYIDLLKRQIRIKLNFKNIPDSIVRLFKMTINPNVFNLGKLTSKTHNGGNNLETFKIDTDFNHGSSIENVSNYTSSSNSFGVTKGKFIVGDNQKSIIFEIDKSLSALVAMLEFSKLKNKYFLRLFFSAYESDDTSFFMHDKKFSSSILISAKKGSINSVK